MHQKFEGEHVDEIFKSRKSEIALLFTKQTNKLSHQIVYINCSDWGSNIFISQNSKGKPWCEIHQDRRLWGKPYKPYVKALVNQTLIF